MVIVVDSGQDQQGIIAIRMLLHVTTVRLLPAILVCQISGVHLSVRQCPGARAPETMNFLTRC